MTAWRRLDAVQIEMCCLSMARATTERRHWRLKNDAWLTFRSLHPSVRPVEESMCRCVAETLHEDRDASLGKIHNSHTYYGKLDAV